MNGRACLYIVHSPWQDDPVAWRERDTWYVFLPGRTRSPEQAAASRKVSQLDYLSAYADHAVDCTSSVTPDSCEPLFSEAEALSMSRALQAKKPKIQPGLLGPVNTWPEMRLHRTVLISPIG